MVLLDGLRPDEKDDDVVVANGSVTRNSRSDSIPSASIHICVEETKEVDRSLIVSATENKLVRVFALTYSLYLLPLSRGHQGTVEAE